MTELQAETRLERMRKELQESQYQDVDKDMKFITEEDESQEDENKE